MFKLFLSLILAVPDRVTFLAAFADDQTALQAPLALKEMGIRPSILEYMDQWTIDCLQKYVGKEVFPGIEPHPMLLIEVDGDEPDARLGRGLARMALEQSEAAAEDFRAAAEAAAAG